MLDNTYKQEKEKDIKTMITWYHITIKNHKRKKKETEKNLPPKMVTKRGTNLAQRKNAGSDQQKIQPHPKKKNAKITNK